MKVPISEVKRAYIREVEKKTGLIISTKSITNIEIIEDGIYQITLANGEKRDFIATAIVTIAPVEPT